MLRTLNAQFLPGLLLGNATTDKAPPRRPFDQSRLFRFTSPIESSRSVGQKAYTRIRGIGRMIVKGYGRRTGPRRSARARRGRARTREEGPGGARGRCVVSRRARSGRAGGTASGDRPPTGQVTAVACPRNQRGLARARPRLRASKSSPANPVAEPPSPGVTSANVIGAGFRTAPVSKTCTAGSDMSEPLTSAKSSLVRPPSCANLCE